MFPRITNSIDMMVSQARQKLDEIKDLQFFGGDSLNLKRYSQVLAIPPNSPQHCWRIVMTPENTETTLPFDASSKPADANSFARGDFESVHRTDGAFEWLFITNSTFSPNTENIKIQIEYVGKASFELTQLG